LVLSAERLAGRKPVAPRVSGPQIDSVDKRIVNTWRADGFVILPAYLSAEDLAPALGELETMFPTPEGFHDGTDPRRDRYIHDEFDGIDVFPFASTN
jgi:hypothetical protein